MEKNTRYYSFEDVAIAMGFQINTKKKDEKKIAKQKEKLLGVCPVCKEPMNYVSGTNIISCKNEKCKGYKRTKETTDGEKVWYDPVFRTLDEKGSAIARRLFEE